MNPMRSFGTDSDHLSICLIGGTGRSGTTILKRVFSKHPEVAYVPEWRFVVDPDGLIDFYNTFSASWSPYLYDVKVRRLEKLLRDVGRRSFVSRLYRYGLRLTGLERRIPFKLTLRYAGINVVKYCPAYFDLVEQLIGQLVEFRYRGTWVGGSFLQESSLAYGSLSQKKELADVLGDFFRQVVRCVLENQEAKHYVEDNTWNILWVDRILELVPEAKLVHIYRDPRDVVASFTKQAWAPSNPVEAAKFYRGIMERWKIVRQHVPDHSIREISLESLVSDPKSVLKELCDFWGIEWDASLLDTDLSRAHSGRWKTDLTAEQQEQISLILDGQLNMLGYRK